MKEEKMLVCDIDQFMDLDEYEGWSVKEIEGWNDEDLEAVESEAYRS